MALNTINQNCVSIEVPPYLTEWDMEKPVNRAVRMVVPGSVCLINMAKVNNVFSATSRLIIRVYEKAARLGCPVFIINASNPVYNALHTLQIDELVPVLGRTTADFQRLEVVAA